MWNNPFFLNLYVPKVMSGPSYKSHTSHPTGIQHIFPVMHSQIIRLLSHRYKLTEQSYFNKTRSTIYSILALNILLQFLPQLEHNLFPTFYPYLCMYFHFLVFHTYSNVFPSFLLSILIYSYSIPISIHFKSGWPLLPASPSVEYQFTHNRNL